MHYRFALLTIFGVLLCGFISYGIIHYANTNDAAVLNASCQCSPNCPCGDKCNCKITNKKCNDKCTCATSTVETENNASHAPAVTQNNPPQPPATATQNKAHQPPAATDTKDVSIQIDDECGCGGGASKAHLVNNQLLCYDCVCHRKRVMEGIPGTCSSCGSATINKELKFCLKCSKDKKQCQHCGQALNFGKNNTSKK